MRLGEVRFRRAASDPAGLWVEYSPVGVRVLFVPGMNDSPTIPASERAWIALGLLRRLIHGGAASAAEKYGEALRILSCLSLVGFSRHVPGRGFFIAAAEL